MPVPYQTQLDFFCQVLDRAHIRTQLLRPETAPPDWRQLGLEKPFSWAGNLCVRIYDFILKIEPRTIYRLTDTFGARTFFFRLPNARPDETLVAGPYLPHELPNPQLLEKAAQLGVQPALLPHIRQFYEDIPVVDPGFLLALLESFSEVIWGAESNFTTIDLDYTHLMEFSPLQQPQEATDADIIQRKRQVLEERYAMEAKMIDAVARGQAHKLTGLFAGFSQRFMEQRTRDPVRNLKNYAIVMNTMLRKAAQSGGVHPYYLDDTSSAFARQIENMTEETQIEPLMRRMMETYCRLVQRRAIQGYSPLVQKVIIQVDSDMAGDLSPRGLAAMVDPSPSYLASVFKKETGRTLTDYVNHRRVELASRLLISTRLQVQTIAQHCGISDVNYFSRLFKKHTGLTPREYRLRQRETILN